MKPSSISIYYFLTYTIREGIIYTVHQYTDVDGINHHNTA